MKSKSTIAIFWFRRDLRLNDNTGLNAALRNNEKVLPIFIFDANILDDLEPSDPRGSFIHNCLSNIQFELNKIGTSIQTFYGNPNEIFQQLIDEYSITDVFINKDYEPYAQSRDREIYELLQLHDIQLHGFKDQVIFEKLEICKDDGKPYTVFTPYKNKWLSNFSRSIVKDSSLNNFSNFYRSNFKLIPLHEMGFTKSTIEVPDYKLFIVDEYAKYRDFPSLDKTSFLSTHLRFGTVSIRQIMSTISSDSVFFSELIWREFFMQILFNFPDVIHSNFKSKYDYVEWRNNPEEFKAWCDGNTGYPIVDAGIKQLNETGLMHNRVRMITAGFLCKHLLIDWRWGEAYFASRLLDYDLSANNGNWQWAAGTGCDSAPYFRIFNPSEQQKKFDKELGYIKKWNPDYENKEPIVEHKFARERALGAYKKALQK